MKAVYSIARWLSMPLFCSDLQKWVNKSSSPTCRIFFSSSSLTSVLGELWNMHCLQTTLAHKVKWTVKVRAENTPLTSVLCSLSIKRTLIYQVAKGLLFGCLITASECYWCYHSATQGKDMVPDHSVLPAVQLNAAGPPSEGKARCSHTPGAGAATVLPL